MANENKVVNDESILNSVKKLLMLGEEYTLFDQDIILNINTVLANLTQMGVGKEGGLVIFDETAKWSDFIGDAKNLQQIKTYVYLKVRVLFEEVEVPLDLWTQAIMINGLTGELA